MALNKYVEAVYKQSNQDEEEKKQARLNRFVQAAVNGAEASPTKEKTIRSTVADQYTKQQKQQQKRNQMLKTGRQTTAERVDTGESDSEWGAKNALSYRGVDQREIPIKELTQYQIDKAKREAMEKNNTPHERNLGDTILDTANAGAGTFVTGMADAADFLANLIPNAVAGIRGEENPEHSFTGQLFKPVTDATQKFSDWAHADTDASAQRAREDVADSKAGQLAVELGIGTVGAIPNAALAMMTAGGSLAGEVGATLAPQAAGLGSTTLNAVQKVTSNPSFQLSFAQSLGSGYQDAKAAGASEANATAAAFLSAAANALVEVGGGLETLPDDLTANDLSTYEKALKWLTSALDEGKEEVVQGVISALTTKVAANSDASYFSMEDTDAVINPTRMAQEFGMGAAVGGILSGAQMLGTDAYNRAVTRLNSDTQSNAQTDTQTDTQTAVDTATDTAADPLEFAIQETMKPTKEQQAFDQAMEDTANWMLGKEKTATADAETGNAKVVADTGEIEPSLLSDWSKARTALIEYARKHFPASVVNNDTGKEIGISRNGLDKFLSGKIVKEKYASGYHIPELIQNAHKVTGANNYHAEQVQDIPTYEYFDSPIEIDGKDYTAHIRVRNTRSGDKYYGHTISEVENIEIEPKAVRVPELDFSTAQPVDKTANSSNFNISASDQNVNQNQQTSSDNDMGAKKSDFKHEVKQSKGKTTPDYEAAHNVPEDARTNQTYDAVTEAVTNYNAKLRLEQDYDGELEAMRQKTSWDAQEMSMARMVLEDLWAEADETDSWDAYKDWAKVFEEHKQEGGRALQNLAQINRRTGAGIMQEAASILDSSDLRRKTDADAVLSDISDRSKQFNRIVRHKDVDGLVQLIKDTAAKRNTGYQIRKNGTQKQSKYLNWALKRVSTYAKSGKLTGNVDANLEINASNIQNPDVAFQFLQDFAATGILNIAADTQKVSKGTQVMALRRSGMLSKLATTMRNLTSNSSFNVVDTLARDISVPLDMLFSVFTKTRSTSMDYGYLSKTARQGSLDNIAIASLETSLDVNGRDNSGKYTAGGQRTFKMSGNAVERFLSRLEALQGYEMYVTDEMSKGRTQAEVQRGTDKLYEQGKIKAGDDSLRNAGAQTALYRIFQDETALSNATLKMRDALNEVHAGDVGLGDVMLPFAQVPANLADRAIDYSPAGLAKTTGKLVEALSKAKKGEFTAADQARVVQSLGRNITGSAMIGIAAALAANGLIRVVNPGDEDENKDKAAFEKMQGQNGTQWNLSATMRKLNGGDPTWQDGDELMSIAFLEPMNAQLTIGALLAEDMELEGQLTAETALKDSFTGSLTAIMELPMFDTFADAIDAYTYSNKERTGDKLLDAGNTLAANEVASLIPNWMKGVRQGLDPYQRDLYSKDNVWGQVADQYQAVFGKRSELPIKQDSFGQDMTNEGGVKNFLNANILPGYVTKYHTDPLIEEITEIAEATGDNSIFPSRKAPDELSIDGEKVPLTYAEQQAYQKAYGNADEAIRTGLMESEAYDKLSYEEKQKAHGYSETYAKQTAASSVNGDYDADSWVEELQGKTDAEIVEAILYKTFSSIADRDEYSSKYAGMADLVDGGKLSDAMAITMMPSSMQTAYQDVAKAGGVSVNEWLDMYAYAYAAGKTDGGTQDTDATRTAALDYINRQNWSESKKTAAANAVYSYLPNTVRIDVDVPYDWALDQGESGLATVVSNMSDSQKENYQKYIEGHFDNDKVGLYMDAYKFKGSAKTIYKDDGETVEKSAKDQVIEYIDAMDLTDREKIRIYLGLGYSINKIPDIWDKS